MAFVQRSLRLQHLQSGNPNRSVNNIDVTTNAFTMDFPTQVLHHYDDHFFGNQVFNDVNRIKVLKVIEPEDQSECPIRPNKGNELVMRVQSENPGVFTKRAAFDGKRNLFAPESYFAKQTFIVNWAKDPQADRNKRKVSVEMTHVNDIDFGILRRYIQTEQNSHKDQNDVNLMINMLNVLVQATPKQKAGILTTARSIFVQSEQARNSIGPLQLWRGYFQTVRPAFDKLVINIDVTVGVILPADKLEHVCASYLNLRNLHDLRRLSPKDFQRLRQFLKGVVKAEVDIGVHRSKPARMIKDLIQDVGSKTFERDGETVTIAQHFMETHNIAIQPNTLGIKIGTAIFPVTCCKSVEQFYKNRASPEVIKAALDFTPPTPSARAAEIRKAFGHFDYRNSGFLVNAGINVNQTPQATRGRFLEKPSILFFNGARKTLDQRAGVWDVMRQRLAKPATISTWVVVEFAQADDRSLDYFLKELVNALRSLGISASPPARVLKRSIQVNIDQMLGDLVQEFHPDLILAVLPDPAEEQYRKIKRFGDIVQGVATQCVRWSNNLKKNVGNGKVNQYQNNLILKINPKMGGINFFADSPVLRQASKSPFMIIGADVSHPGPGSLMPSIASVVASYDREACRYAASVQVQSSRVEVIENFGIMFKELLEIFVKKNNTFPQDLYLFRDGVSEGEFENVQKYEESAINTVVASVYPSGRRPKIVYVVVGKRHHVRFFPPSPDRSGDPRGNGNFSSGLVVDNDVVHPRYCDFYLQSQPGLKGTSIPSHYTLLRNDIGIPVASLQDLAYALCHCYSRSTRSVKIPAPVYYADLVCRRAKFHYNDQVSDYAMSSTSGSDDMSAHLDYYRRNFDPVNGNMRDLMYYV